jgi:hypothetical protein
MTDTPATPAPAVHWRVTASQEQQAPGAAGTYTKGRQVFFQLDSGPSGSVFIPNDQLSADSVRAAITAAAAQLADIHALSS